MLRTILFVSDASGECAANQIPDYLDDIQTEALISNKERNITGVLSYSRGLFFQLIEGEDDHVQSLLASLREDLRHENIRILLDIETEQRAFDEWSVVLKPDHQTTLKFSGFLLRHIDLLPLIEQSQHDILELFVDDIFH